MKLKLLRDNLLYLERYVDEGTKTYSRFAGKSEVAPEYRPQSDVSSFELMAVKVPSDQVSIWQSDPDRTLRDFYIQPDGVRFVAHPETWGDQSVERIAELHNLPMLESLRVAPTASTRTVMTLEEVGNCVTHFLKLHCPRRISRFNRRLRRKNINNGIAISEDLANLKLGKFAYLPEVLGFTFGSSQTSWGFLVREQTPRPFMGVRSLIPCFALYGGDLKNPDDPPILIQLIENARVKPETFVLEELMVPIVECWVKVVRERGILLESHAQNLLLEIDENLKPLRIVHRDFDVWVDLDARQRIGLAVPFMGKPLGVDSGYPVEQHYSLIYDRFIGCEFFDYLVQTLERYYAIDANRIRRHVAESFHQFFPDSSKFFPPSTTFYFSDDVLEENDFKLIDTKEKPRWR